MTAKEKSKELIDIYYSLFSLTLENTICEYEASKCALTAVEMIVEALNFNQWQNRSEIEYYNEVKKELRKYE